MVVGCDNTELELFGVTASLRGIFSATLNENRLGRHHEE